MTEQHTPEPSFGKWVLGSETHGDEYALCISVIRPTGRRDFIARALPLDDSDEAEANARLIAAARETAAERDRLKAEKAELVGALDEGLGILAIFQAIFPGWEYNSHRSAINSWEAKARAAIAKAKG